MTQSVIDSTNPSNSTSSGGGGKSLGGGVVAGLAVVGGLVGLALLLLLLGLLRQRAARRRGADDGFGGMGRSGGVAVVWTDVSYIVPRSSGLFTRRKGGKTASGYTDEKVVLDNVSGRVEPGQMMAVLGPSGTPKTFGKEDAF